MAPTQLSSSAERSLRAGLGEGPMEGAGAGRTGEAPMLETELGWGAPGPLLAWVRALGLGLALGLGAAHLALLGAQLLGVSFAVAAPTSVALLGLGLVAGLLLARPRAEAAAQAHDGAAHDAGQQAEIATASPLSLGPALLGLLALMLTCAALALSSNRDVARDDSQYIPSARHALEHPAEPMDFEVHWLDGGSRPFTSEFFLNSMPYDFLRAALARVTGAELLDVYFLWGAVLGGLLLPLFLFRQLRGFVERDGSAVVGTWFAMLVVALLGQQLRSLGMCGLTRIFEGKILFLAVGPAWFSAALLDLLRGRRLACLELGAACMALIGTTASAVTLLPCLFVVLVGAELLGPSRRRTLRRLAPALLALLPLAAYGVGMKVRSGLVMDMNTGGKLRTVGHHLDLVLGAGEGGGLPHGWLVLVLSSLVAVRVLAGRERGLLVGWLGLAFLLLVNPVVDWWVSGWVTTPWLYWRVLYLLPFPLTVGVAGVFLARRLPVAATLAVALLLAGLHFVPGSPSIFRSHGTQLGAPRWKLNRELVEAAQRIVERVPPGPMLAARSIGQLVTVVRSGYPQVHNGPHTFQFWDQRDQRWRAHQRVLAGDFATQREPEAIESFERVTQEPRLRSVVLRGLVVDGEVRSYLQQQGFDEHFRMEDFYLAWRSDASMERVAAAGRAAAAR
jgi:hypothetical protein